MRAVVEAPGASATVSLSSTGDRGAGDERASSPKTSSPAAKARPAAARAIRRGRAARVMWRGWRESWVGRTGGDGGEGPGGPPPPAPPPGGVVAGGAAWMGAVRFNAGAEPAGGGGPRRDEG